MLTSLTSLLNKHAHYVHKLYSNGKAGFLRSEAEVRVPMSTCIERASMKGLQSKDRTKKDFPP